MKEHPARRAISLGAAATLLAATIGLVGVATRTPNPAQAATVHKHDNTAALSRAAVSFRNQMRKLWEDHITWTRMFIVSSVADLPDAETAAARLLRNQDHIGDAIKPFYGEAAGDHLTQLLRDHILIAAEILGAAKNGDSPGIEEANARWHENSDEIADFLSAANAKSWPRAEMREMMSGHLDWTLTEAVARLNADWEGDVKAYNRIHRDILHMADMLSRGIITQFPGRF